MAVQAPRKQERRAPFPADQQIGQLEVVATFDGPMPTGVTVSRTGRVFVCFPKWGDPVEYTVAEIVDGRTVPYPDAATNQPQSDHDARALVSVQSVVVDATDRLWILDTGSPMFKPPEEGGPKLVCVDLSTNQVVQTIVFPQHVALPTSYLNDVRLDLRRGKAGAAFITDSSDQGANGLIVIDLESSSCWRRLHDHPSTKAEPILPMVEGQPLYEHQAGRSPKPVKLGADGIAISADGSRLFYCPLMSRKLYSVGVDALLDSSKSDKQVGETVTDEGDKGGIADGLQTDAEGRIYLTSPEHDAILRRAADGYYETVAHDGHLLWPDTLHLAEDGYLYVTCNQLNRQPRYHEGRDLRQKPYVLARMRIDAHPVLLG